MINTTKVGIRSSKTENKPKKQGKTELFDSIFGKKVAKFIKFFYQSIETLLFIFSQNLVNLKIQCYTQQKVSRT